MLLTTWRFVTIILGALSMAMAFAHLLELPPRMRFDGLLWTTTTQRLYTLFGPPVGASRFCQWLSRRARTISTYTGVKEAGRDS